MKKTEFTYVLEPGNNKGFIWLYEGHRKNTSKNLIYVYDEKDLVEVLKQNEKGAIITYHESSKILEEGNRLSKVLNLEFQHP